MLCDSILKVLCSSNSYCTVVLQVQALSCFYIVLDFVRESALSFRCLQQKRGFFFENDSGHETYIHGVCVCVMLLVRHSHSLSIAFVLLCLLPVWTPATNSKFGIDRNVLVMSDPKVRLHCWMVLPSAWKPTCECSQLICWNTFGLLLHSYCIRHALQSFTELGKEGMQQKSTYWSTWAVWGVIFYWIFTALCGPWQPALGVQPVQWWFSLVASTGLRRSSLIETLAERKQQEKCAWQSDSFDSHCRFDVTTFQSFFQAWL